MRYNPDMGTMIDLSKPERKTSTAEEDFLRSHYDTEIIRLRNYDNFYSLMDRLHQRDMSGEDIRKLLLIWPVRSRILETPVEFGRLHGWCVRHNYQLAMVIPGDDVRLKMAAEQGIPAFKNLKDAEKADWELTGKLPDPEDTTERMRRLAVLRKDAEQHQEVQTPFMLRLLFFLLALAALAGMAYAVLPQARVDITPWLTKEEIVMTVWTNDRLNTVTMGGGIPTIEKKLELPMQAVVSSGGLVHTEPALSVGEVFIRNICDRSESSSAGVALSTEEETDNGISFITLDSVYLAPGEEKKIRIEALQGGPEGNLPAGSIRYAAYPQSRCWEIRQETPTSGGQSGIYAAPTEADLESAQDEILRRVPETVREALMNDPEGKDLLPLGEASVTAIRHEQSTPELGFASETLNLRETLEVTVKTVRRSDMETIIRGQSSRMNAQVAGLTEYEILSGPTEENGLSRWSIRAEYLVYEPETNEEALKIMLRGKTLPQAEAILGTLEHVKESRITLLPSWMMRMPLAAQNIRVSIHPALEIEEP